MPLTIAENSNNDMYRGADGNIAFVSDILATAQLCKSRIEAQRGEMIYAMDQGMPTRSTMWDQYNPIAFSAFAQEILLATPGVVSVTSFDMQQADNTLSYTANIVTIYGQTTIQGALLP